MTPKEKALELVADCIQIQLSNPDLKSQYEMAKIQAQYSANTAKWSHEVNSKKFVYWEQVKQEIEKTMKTHVTFAEIEQTETFKNLDKCYQNILKKKSSKDDINHGLTVYNSTGVIPSTVSGNNLKVLREIIKN